MEKLLVIVASVSLAVVIILFVLAYRSHSGMAPGMVDGRLKHCPDKPNCVNSEFESDTAHYVEPLVYAQQDSAQVMGRLKGVIVNMGGKVEKEESTYLAASFTSSLFRFVDDLEIRVDTDQNTVHLRSASRVGYGDNGVNRKRVEQLKSSFF